MYFTGNRVGETLPYQWRDFDFTNRYVLVYKGITREYTFDEQGNKIGKSKTVIKGPKTEEGIRPLPLVDALYEILIQWYEHQKAKEKFLGVSLTATPITFSPKTTALIARNKVLPLSLLDSLKETDCINKESIFMRCASLSRISCLQVKPTKLSSPTLWDIRTLRLRKRITTVLKSLNPSRRRLV